MHHQAQCRLQHSLLLRSDGLAGLQVRKLLKVLVQGLGFRVKGLGFRVWDWVFGVYIYIYWGYIGIVEKKMETTILYRDAIEIMEKKMETTIYWVQGCRAQGM